MKALTWKRTRVPKPDLPPRGNVQRPSIAADGGDRIITLHAGGCGLVYVMHVSLNYVIYFTSCIHSYHDVHSSLIPSHDVLEEPHKQDAQREQR